MKAVVERFAALNEFRDPAAFMAASGVMVAVVESIKKFAATGGPQSGATRKVLHVVAGPVFLLTWPWFSDEARAKWWAAMVPLAMTAKFALVGLGLWKDPADVRVMSRTGSEAEILKGPLFYGAAFIVATLLAFKSLSAAAAIAALCFGDAAAETFGKRYGATNHLPWSPRKSAAGSLAFFLASTAGILAAILAFRAFGFLPEDNNDNLQASLLPTLLAAYLGTIVESLPMHDIDNLLVPATVGFAFHHFS